jgi:Carboxypeptidase regulatory-like domain/TonB-dependent Receptor Plug Domain
VSRFTNGHQGTGVSRLLLGTLSLLFILCVDPISYAQLTTGSIVGSITDNSGAVIPGVTVTALNIQTGTEARATSNESGAYEFLLLRPGTHTLTAESSGFQRLVRENVVVRTTEVTRVNLTLEVGMVTETVTVTAETPLLQSEQATLGHVVEQRTITSIPLATRNFTQILGTSPGVVGSIMNADQRGTGSDSVSVNGARRGSNNLLVDGAPTTNQLNNAPDGDGTPSIEFLGEFKVLTSLYSAEYGRNQGSVINVTTRSGTNSLHGSVYEFLRNTKLNARPFFSPQRQVNVQNQFGANVGGPIIRDKTFFFVGWESSRQRNANGSGARFRRRVATAEERAGNFGSTSLWDPLSGALFPNNTIPAARIDPVSKNIQDSFFPLPNLNDPGSSDNFEDFATEPTDLDQYTVRIDHRFSDNDTINGRWFESLQEDLDPFSRGPRGFGNLANRQKHTWGVTYTHVFSPSFIMEVRSSGDYTDQFTKGENKTDPTTVGLQPIPGVTFAGEAAGMPRIVISNYLGNFGNDSNWSDYIDRYTTGSTFTWTRSNHNFKFGAEWQFADLNPQNNLSSRGRWTYNGFGTGQGGADGNEYADFLLTLPRDTTFGSSDEFEIGGQLKMRSNYYSFFFNDDWKASTNLTVNWGFRYEADFQAAAYNLNMVGWWPENYRGLDGTIESTGLVQGGINGVPNNVVDGDWNNVMPRVGIAWRLTDKWVIRAGAGLYFDLRTGQIAQSAFSNPPTFTEIRSDCTVAGQTCSLATPDHWTYQDPGHMSGVVPFPVSPTETRTYTATERNTFTDNAWQYNLAIQRELPTNMLAEVAYVGTKGTHLNSRINPNSLVPEEGITAPLVQGVNLTRLYPGFGDIAFVNQNLNSSYHSLQATLKQRMRSSTFQLSYTWSKTIGEGNEGSRFKTSIFAVPWNDWSRARGPANFDRTHRLSLVFNHDLPSPFVSGFAKFLLNDWSLNGFLVAQTGTALTVTNRDSGRGIGGSAESTTASNLFSDVSAGAPLLMSDVNGNSTKENLDHYINPDAFAKAAPFTFGNSGRGMFRAPGQWTLDFSVFKDFPVTERFKLQFRSEFFNLLNHANFGGPTTNLDSSAYGTIRGTTVNARLAQFALKLVF